MPTSSLLQTEMKIHHHYNKRHHGLSSASVIINYLEQELKITPLSVIDVGCGLGQWLHVFLSSSALKVKGVDGQHVPASESLIDEENRVRSNLEEFIATKSDEHFDLVICLEVAEHIDFTLADALVDKLTSLGNTILFSAAIPGQTGENHVNEQPHSFWLDKFEQRGYLILDPFRKFFWNDSRVNWWYAQNLFLICKPSLCSEEAMKHKYDRNMYVHPHLLDLYKPAMSSSVANGNISLYSKAKSFIKRIIK